MGIGVNGVVVQADGISRRYGEGATAVDALRDVDLSVQPGELVTAARSG